SGPSGGGWAAGVAGRAWPMPPRLHALTGLRFLAAAMIVVYHSGEQLSFPIAPHSTFGWTNAVSLFFVLSGFVLTLAYPRLDGPGAWRQFWRARFARIWPGHVAVLALLAALLPVKYLDATGGASEWTFAANLALVHGWLPIPRWYFSFNC